MLKALLIAWLLGLTACSSMPTRETQERPKLTQKYVLDVLSKQLTQPYSIYKYRRRFRVDSDRQQLNRTHYLQKLNTDLFNGYIHFTQAQSDGFDYVEIKPSVQMQPVKVYALNLFGFAFADGKRVIESVVSIKDNIVHFQLRVIPGPILRSHGFTDSSKVFNARAKLEFNQEKGDFEVIVFEQYSNTRHKWRKQGFEVDNHGEKTVFFIDPDTELLYKFLSEHDPKSKSFEAMQPFQKYIQSITKPF